MWECSCLCADFYDQDTKHLQGKRERTTINTSQLEVAGFQNRNWLIPQGYRRKMGVQLSKCNCGTSKAVVAVFLKSEDTLCIQ